MSLLPNAGELMFFNLMPKDLFPTEVSLGMTSGMVVITGRFFFSSRTKIILMMRMS